MIFQHTWQWIFDSSPHTYQRKAQTSRRKREGESQLPDGSVWLTTRSGNAIRRYYVGQLLAVQPGRGKRAIGQIRITRIRYVSRAWDMDHDEAVREGFATPGQFREVWKEMYGERALQEPRWGLEFEVVERPDELRAP
jgi:hypothetical protein